MTFSRRKTVIQLWHGSPLKSLGYTTADDDTSLWRDYHSCAALIVISKLEAAMTSWCFNVHAHKIHLLGRARCNRLFEPTSPGASPKITDFTGSLPPYDKLILLCPTFRNALRCAQRSRLMPIEDFDAARMHQFLEKHRAVLLVRGHYMRYQWESHGHLPDESFGGESDRIIELGFKSCPNIYQVLDQIDVLVTDYSSIYFDFLLLNRPIVFTPFDLQQYQLKRGLRYDDFDFWTPGPKVTGFNQWLSALGKAFCGDDGYAAQRIQINKLLNTYQTDDTCSRIVALIDRINQHKTQAVPKR